MSVESQYSRKLLLRSNDASNLCLSSVKAKEYWETHDVYTKSVPYILRQLHLRRFHTVHDFCASHGFNIPYIVARNRAKFGVAHDIHPSMASRKLWSRYSRLTARMEYRQEDIYRTKYNLEDNSLVMAIHPCRNLAHRVVEIAIDNNLPVVISPCCIGSKKDSLISKFDNILPYTRWCIAVAEPLYKADYDIKVRYIRESATPVNTIIVGIP